MVFGKFHFLSKLVYAIEIAQDFQRFKPNEILQILLEIDDLEAGGQIIMSLIVACIYSGKSIKFTIKGKRCSSSHFVIPYIVKLVFNENIEYTWNDDELCFKFVKYNDTRDYKEILTCFQDAIIQLVNKKKKKRMGTQVALRLAFSIYTIIGKYENAPSSLSVLDKVLNIVQIHFVDKMSKLCTACTVCTKTGQLQIRDAIALPFQLADNSIKWVALHRRYHNKDWVFRILSSTNVIQSIIVQTNGSNSYEVKIYRFICFNNEYNIEGTCDIKQSELKN